MRSICIALLFIISCTQSIIAQTPGADISNENVVRKILLQLRHDFFEAQKRGDRVVLEQLISDSFYFVHSTGVVTRKKDFIDRTVAQAGKQPDIIFLDDELHIYGNTAVWLTRSVSTTVDGTEINFRSTDVLVKNKANWQWVSVHSSKLSTRPKGINLSEDSLKNYVGSYQINAERTFTVTEEKGNLIGQAPGLRQKDLIPVSSTEFVWFSPESNVDMHILFLRDETGKVKQAALKSDGKEAWRAMKLD
jgi:hypothetical protein